MRKIRFFSIIMALVLVAVLAASCSSETRPAATAKTAVTSAAATAMQAAADSPAPAPAATVSPCATPAATATPGPTPTATPAATPEPAASHWPMATLAPAATPLPSGAPLTASDYYVVRMHSVNESEADPYDENDEYINDETIDRAGVVDRRGRVVLPFIFNDIKEINSETASRPAAAGAPVYFLATPFRLDKNVLTDGDYGYLYDCNGKRVSDQKYDWMNVLGGKLIAEKMHGGYTGVVNFSLKKMIPFKYHDVVQFGSLIAAVRGSGGDCFIDFYDLSCKLKGSLPVGGSDIYPNEDTLFAKGRNGLYGIIDETMKWTCPPRWSEKKMDMDQFEDPSVGNFLYLGLVDRAVEGGELGYSWLDRYGKPLLPSGYTNLAPVFDQEYSELYYHGHALFIATGAGRAALIDDVGTVLFQTDKTGNSDELAYYPDGVILCAGEAFDMGGKRLLPGVEGIRQCVPEDRLFVCKDACYRENGAKLPLPACMSVEFLSHDRFLILMDVNHYGICNGQGLWLVPPVVVFPQNFTWPIFDMTDSNSGYVKTGLFDGNGDIVVAPVCDYISDMGGGVYEIEYNGEIGLVDSDGRCFWHTSLYDALMD